jgi:hypothetical protein
LPRDEVRTAFRELVRRRADGTPVAYLVGHREFYSLSFRVNPEVLIPRPETELLVVATLDLAKQEPRDPGATSLQLADVGTGSGIIAICLAKHLPRCHVTAIDISAGALVVAAENARTHGVADRIQFIESDLFANLPSPEKRESVFAEVASNLPSPACGKGAGGEGKISPRPSDGRGAGGEGSREAGQPHGHTQTPPPALCLLFSTSSLAIRPTSARAS